MPEEDHPVIVAEGITEMEVTVAHRVVTVAHQVAMVAPVVTAVADSGRDSVGSVESEGSAVLGILSRQLATVLVGSLRND